MEGDEKLLVLVVDDMGAVRLPLQAWIEEVFGWQALLADCGERGVILARNHPIHAVICDMNMPCGNGRFFYTHMAGLLRERGIVFVWHCSPERPEDWEFICQTGERHFEKGTEVREILEAIRDMRASRQAERRPAVGE